MLCRAIASVSTFGSRQNYIFFENAHLNFDCEFFRSDLSLNS